MKYFRALIHRLRLRFERDERGGRTTLIAFTLLVLLAALAGR